MRAYHLFYLLTLSFAVTIGHAGQKTEDFQPARQFFLSPRGGWGLLYQGPDEEKEEATFALFTQNSERVVNQVSPFYEATWVKRATALLVQGAFVCDSGDFVAIVVGNAYFGTDPVLIIRGKDGEVIRQVKLADIASPSTIKQMPESSIGKLWLWGGEALAGKDALLLKVWKDGSLENPTLTTIFLDLSTGNLNVQGSGVMAPEKLSQP